MQRLEREAYRAYMAALWYKYTAIIALLTAGVFFLLLLLGAR